MKRNFLVLTLFLFFSPAVIPQAEAMHIAEGILPAQWAVFWYIIAIPFIAYGLRDIRRRSQENPEYKSLLGLIGAAVFIVSSMPIPVPIAGTCSHPAGTALAAILLGPGPAIVVSSIALLFHALFMAHGGLTTLGANVVALGVVGSFAGWLLFYGARKINVPLFAAAFVAAMFAQWATYATTAFEMAAALHGDGSMAAMFLAIAAAFMPTQVPLGVLEGVLTGLALTFVLARKPELGWNIGLTKPPVEAGAE